MNNSDLRVCAKIREISERIGVSRAELARRTKISYRIIHEIFKGRARPRDTTINRIAEALGTTYDQIVNADQGLPANEVKESPAIYTIPVRAGATKPNGSSPLTQSIRILAELLEVPESEVWAAFAELLKGKIGNQSQGGDP